MKVLLVEDDMRVASFIRRGLKEEDYAVDYAGDGEEAVYLAGTNEYDLIILDLMIPKRSGLDVLKTLRENKMDVPVLVLTARDDPRDKITGLDSGADDYLTKPFNFDELLARVRALLRRKGPMLPGVLKVVDLELDPVHHRVTRGGKNIELTSREYALLDFLLRHVNQVVTRTMLYEHVWEQDFDSMTNVIDVHVARLRKKIDDGFKQKILVTLRGRGYMVRSSEKSKA